MRVDEWFFDTSYADTGGVGTRMAITLAGATFTTGTWNLFETGAFTSYTFNAGDRIYIGGGTAVTAGYYEIASRTDNDNVVLTGDITTDASSPTDVTGTSRPYGNLNDGIKKITEGATGTRINIQAGTTATLTESLYTSFVDAGTTAAFAPTQVKPLYVQGYTTIPADGGRATIDGAATYSIMSTGLSVSKFTDLHLTNTGAADVINILNSSLINRCEVDNSSGNGIVLAGNGGTAIHCEVHNIGGYGISGGYYQSAHYNYIYNDGANEMTHALYGCQSTNNIVSVSGATNGHFTGSGMVAMNNSYYAAPGSTGYGVGNGGGANAISAVIVNNLVEGFDTNYPFTGAAANCGNWTFFGNYSFNPGTTHYDHSHTNLYSSTDYWNSGNLLETTNFTLTQSPFANAASGNFMPTAIVKEAALPHEFAHGQAI